MSRILHCSSIISRSSRGFKPFCYNEYLLKREFHLRVLSQETPFVRPLIHGKFGCSASFHTSAVFASADDPQSKPRHDDGGDDAHNESPHSSSEGGGGTQQDRGETIIERLRRLSMTPPEEYKLSPKAVEKAREMAQVRAEIRRKGEEWKWDQRNVRPGGFPQQNQRPFRMRNWDEDFEDDYRRPPPRDQGRYSNRRDAYGQEDDYDTGYDRRQQQNHRSQDRYGSNRGLYNDDHDEFESDDGDRRSLNRRDFGGRSGNFSRGRKPQFSRVDEEDDMPEAYEVEMQKLRERMEKAREEKKAILEARDATQSKKSSESAQEEKKQDSEEGSSGTSLVTYAHYVSSDSRHESQSKVSNESTEAETKSVSPEDKVNLDFAGYDPDTFGNLTVGTTSTLVKDSIGLAIQAELRAEEEALSMTEDNEDDDTRFIPPVEERWNSRRLIKRVRELLKENKLKEAIDTFLGALAEGGFDFDHKQLRHHFNVLIHECSKVGYVEMAFRLFKAMNDRKYEEKIQTYSCLLNACANSPWAKEKNLDRIDKVLLRMKEKGHSPNLITYHALIKAYGRLGETLRAFGVVDEMMNELDRKPTTETFNMLLQACISDKENGFRHALITWKKLISMKSKRRRPDIFTFNLLLRAVRDCGIELHIEGGDKLDTVKLDDPEMKSLPLLPPIVTEEDSNRILSYLVEEKPSQEDAQLVLDSLGEPEIINIKALKHALTFPENRLAVLGGVRGILSQMTMYRVGPNLKTVSELLECAKGIELADVMSVLKAYKIKADVDFYNIAIARCFNKKYDSMAKEFLNMLHLDGHTPNIVTYGAIALGCRTWPEAKKLLEEMDSTKFTPNIAVMGSLLKTAIRGCDPKYVLHIMEELRKREMPINPDILGMLQAFKTRTQRGLISKEMEKPVEPKDLALAIEMNPDFSEHFSLFKMRFEPWLKTVDIKIEPENPWKDEFNHFVRNRKHINYNEEDDIDKLIAEKLGAAN